MIRTLLLLFWGCPNCFNSETAACPFYGKFLAWSILKDHSPFPWPHSRWAVCRHPVVSIVCPGTHLLCWGICNFWASNTQDKFLPWAAMCLILLFVQLISPSAALQHFSFSSIYLCLLMMLISFVSWQIPPASSSFGFPGCQGTIWVRSFPTPAPNEPCCWSLISLLFLFIIIYFLFVLLVLNLHSQFFH